MLTVTHHRAALQAYVNELAGILVESDNPDSQVTQVGVGCVRGRWGWAGRGGGAREGDGRRP